MKKNLVLLALITAMVLIVAAQSPPSARELTNNVAFTDDCDHRDDPSGSKPENLDKKCTPTPTFTNTPKPPPPTATNTKKPPEATATNTLKAREKTATNTPKPPATNTKVPDYKLNLSHVECVGGKVEVHFVLLNVPDGVKPGSITYVLSTGAQYTVPPDPKNPTGNVWHFTDHQPPDGYIDVTSAQVVVGTVTVQLHNPDAYKGWYNCSPSKTATKSATPTATKTKEKCDDDRDDDCKKKTKTPTPTPSRTRFPPPPTPTASLTPTVERTKERCHYDRERCTPTPTLTNTPIVITATPEPSTPTPTNTPIGCLFPWIWWNGYCYPPPPNCLDHYWNGTGWSCPPVTSTPGPEPTRVLPRSGYDGSYDDISTEAVPTQEQQLTLTILGILFTVVLFTLIYRIRYPNQPD